MLFLSSGFFLFNKSLASEMKQMQLDFVTPWPSEPDDILVVDRADVSLLEASCYSRFLLLNPNQKDRASGLAYFLQWFQMRASGHDLRFLSFKARSIMDDTFAKWETRILRGQEPDMIVHHSGYSEIRSVRQTLESYREPLISDQPLCQMVDSELELWSLFASAFEKMLAMKPGALRFPERHEWGVFVDLFCDKIGREAQVSSWLAVAISRCVMYSVRRGMTAKTAQVTNKLVSVLTNVSVVCMPALVRFHSAAVEELISGLQSSFSRYLSVIARSGTAGSTLVSGHPHPHPHPATELEVSNHEPPVSRSAQRRRRRRKLKQQLGLNGLNPAQTVPAQTVAEQT
jgi:hypothetical protein